MLRKNSLIGLVLLFCALIPNLVMAQNSDSKAITASANVFTALSLTKNFDLNFGNVSRGVIPYMNASGGANANVSGGSIQLGQLTATCDAASQIIVGFDAATYTLATGAGNTDDLQMHFVPEVKGGAAHTSISNTGTTVTPGATSYVIYVGGHLYDHATGLVALPGTQTAGSYTTNMTISVNYY